VAQKMVVVSDLSGKMALDEAPITLKVLDHPALGGSPVQLDVLESEVEDLGKHAKEFVLVEVMRSGQQPLRYALEAEDFDKAATDRPMADVLREAPTVRIEAAEPRRRGRPRKSAEGAPSRQRGERDFDIAGLRAWAASNNIDVPQRGRIPGDIVAQYKAAMGEG
jgi:Lsr2